MNDAVPLDHELAASPTPSDSSSDLTRGTVLVVDDTDAQRYTVTRVLRAEGFEVIEAASGHAALESAQLSSIDAVVLDVDLPDIDGYEVCLRLKASTTGFLPVLHLSSAETSAAARERGRAAGSDGHLSHPFEPGALRAAVRALVRLRREEQVRTAQEASTLLLQEALDALPDHIVLLGATGAVVAVNQSWREFGSTNTHLQSIPRLGADYCAICDEATGPGAEDARAAAAGIRRVLVGEVADYALEYSCRAPCEDRWYRMTVRRLLRPGPIAAIVTHMDRTAGHLAARAELDARARADAAHRAQAIDEAFFRALTERSQEFVSIVDTSGIITYVSPSVTHILGYSMDELLGTSPLTIVHDDDRAEMIAALDTLLREGPGAVADVTFRLCRRDGTWRWFEGGAQNLTNDAAVQGITCNVRDVTQRIDAEHARAASEARFRQFVETTLEGVVALDAEGTVTYANAQMGAMVGVPPADLEEQSFVKFMPPEDAGAARAQFLGVSRTMATALESRLRCADGGLVHVRAAISPIRDANGTFTGTLALVSDITEKTQHGLMMAEALRAADLDRRRLQATLEAIPVGVQLANAHGQLTHVNPAARRIWDGRADRETHVESFSEYRGWWPSSHAEVRSGEWALARTLRTLDTISGEMVEIQRLDGERAFVLNSSAPILDANGELTGGVVIDVDVTSHEAEARERERLVASLETERTHLATVFEQAPSFLAVGRGPNHVFERVNPAYQRLIGDRNVIGKSVAEALPEVVAQGFVGLLDEVRATGKPFIGRQVPVQLVREAGAPPETRYIDLVYQRLDQPDGDHALVAHGVDVTEQVLATERLVQSKQRLHDQFAKLPVPTYLWESCDSGFVLLECNEAAVRMVPHSCKDGDKPALEDVFPGMTDISDDLRRCLRNGAVVRRTLQLDLAPPLGRRMLELTMGPQPPDRVLMHVVDTTERTELEAQLRQAQKMDAVGRLAGGVAHDFNNLLTVIGAHSAFLLESLDASDPQHEDATAIHKAAIRAAGLTRQLLAFSRKQILKPVVADLNATISETRRMLERLLGEDIEIVTDLAADLPRVVADPSQIDQVVVNLAVNARDAMPSGGRLTITTSAVTIAESAEGGIVPPGDYVSLTVADTGIGMNLTVQARLFEPFFTTKELGKGTGLGLAMVYGIVKQSAGFITVDSAPGHGSTFHVLLPAVVEGEEEDQLLEAVRVSSRGVETVLLVEDELAVRQVAKRVLRRQGYVVLEAANGEAALEISRTYAANIHLVVTDAVMPGMGGAEVVRRLTVERPGIKAVYMSGYTDDEIVRRGIVSSSLTFVQKPFTPADFSRKVREALDT